MDSCEKPTKGIRNQSESHSDLSSGFNINFNSNDHLSAILFGGRIGVDRKEEYLFTYKDIRKTPVTKTRTVTDYVDFPRLVEPIKGSALKKEGFWSTAEGILRKLKPTGKAKQIITALLERSTLDTKRSRYYHGFPKLYKEMDWTNDLVHTNLNHVVAQTGRLSSNKPNVQNLEEQMRQCVITRF